MNEVKTKKCTKCGEELPLDLFYKDKSSKDGLRYSCKICDKNNTKLTEEKYKKINQYKKLDNNIPKKCPKCGKTKKLSDFSKSLNNKNGHCSWCKTCSADETKRRYFMNKTILDKEPGKDCNRQEFFNKEEDAYIYEKQVHEKNKIILNPEVNEKLKQQKDFPKRIKLIINTLITEPYKWFLVRDLKKHTGIGEEYYPGGISNFILQNLSSLNEFAKISGYAYEYEQICNSFKSRVIKLNTNSCQQCEEFNQLVDEKNAEIENLNYAIQQWKENEKNLKTLIEEKDKELEKLKGHNGWLSGIVKEKQDDKAKELEYKCIIADLKSDLKKVNKKNTDTINQLNKQIEKLKEEKAQMHNHWNGDILKVLELTEIISQKDKEIAKLNIPAATTTVIKNEAQQLYSKIYSIRAYLIGLEKMGMMKANSITYTTLMNMCEHNYENNIA